jgi:hypothetical protein
MYYTSVERAIETLKSLPADSRIFMSYFSDDEIIEAAKMEHEELTEDLKEKIWDRLESADYITDINDISNFIREINNDELWEEKEKDKIWIRRDGKAKIEYDEYDERFPFHLNEIDEDGDENFIDVYETLLEAQQGYKENCKS